MLVIKNWARKIPRPGARSGASVCLALFLAGCGAPGPTALLDGEELIKEGKFKEAIEKLQKATKHLPRNAQAWNHLGLAHHGAGQVEQAQRYYREALRLSLIHISEPTRLLS